MAPASAESFGIPWALRIQIASKTVASKTDVVLAPSDLSYFARRTLVDYLKHQQFRQVIVLWPLQTSKKAPNKKALHEQLIKQGLKDVQIMALGPGQPVAEGPVTRISVDSILDSSLANQTIQAVQVETPDLCLKLSVKQDRLGLASCAHPSKPQALLATDHYQKLQFRL